MSGDKISDATSMESLILKIISKHDLQEDKIFQKYVGQVKAAIEICHNNLIFNVGLLKRVDIKRLTNLKLPLLIEEELIRIIEGCERDRTPLFHIKHHTSAQIHEQERKKKFSIKMESFEKEVIKNTWSQLLNYRPVGSNLNGLQMFCKKFYPILFKVNPPGQRLFKDKDIDEQSKALTNMISWVVNNLNNLENLVPVLAHLGGRHEIYGVKSEDYESFSKAISQAFRDVLGQEMITTSVMNVWEKTMVNISNLMIEAAKQVKMGFRGSLLKEKGDGSWKAVWVNLTLDTLYMFSDESFTKLSSQYSIRGVEGINFPNLTQSNVFELLSTNPPFNLRLSSKNDQDFELWVYELNWRIQALQRVYIDENNDLSDSESANESGKAKRVVAKIAIQTRKKLEARKVESRKSDPSKHETSSHGLLNITNRQKDLVREGWRHLLEGEISNSLGFKERAITRFFDEHYTRFFKTSPSAKRLFEAEGMHTQGRALVRMLAMVVKMLDNPENLVATLETLGGRHEIYGVQPTDYIAFSNCLGDAFQAVLGTDVCTAEMKDAWFKVMMELSTLMQEAGKKIKHKNLNGIVYRKLRKNAVWKKSYISLSLDTLFIYRDEKMVKLRSSYPMSEINGIDVMNADGEVELITKYGFTIELANYRQPLMWFCVETIDALNMWVDAINWRAQAVARVFKEESSSESVNDSSETKKAKKQAKKLKKKKEMHMSHASVSVSSPTLRGKTSSTGSLNSM